MLLPHFLSDQDFADQATDAAILIACHQCQMLVPHQVEQALETLRAARQLVAARCEVCAGLTLAVV